MYNFEVQNLCFVQINTFEIEMNKEADVLNVLIHGHANRVQDDHQEIVQAFNNAYTALSHPQ